MWVDKLIILAQRERKTSLGMRNGEATIIFNSHERVFELRFTCGSDNTLSHEKYD